jgi:hypothetical protein
MLRIIKPVLLCLMGAAGTVTLVEKTEGQVDGRVFPAFRFPNRPRGPWGGWRATPPTGRFRRAS